MVRFQSMLGLAILVFAAWLMSENRQKVNYRTVVAGLVLQIVLCLVLLKAPPCRHAFMLLNRLVFAVNDATVAGTSFVFGFLGGAPLPYKETVPGGSFIFACRGLPLLIVLSALTSLFFYWRVLPVIVRGLSSLFSRSLGIGGCEALGSAANIFVGMTEAPLFIRPYLKNMSRSEVFAVMVTGMATVAGTVMVMYATILEDILPDAMGHILVASIISAPAALVVAKLMVPQVETPLSGEIIHEDPPTGSMDAITKGTTQGVHLVINIIAMLIVCIAIVHLVNAMLGVVLPDVGGRPVTMERVLGLALAPVAWLMGVPWSEAKPAGSLIGVKTVLNEFLAYIQLSELPPETLSPRSRIIVTYALCEFANFGSLGIMIGGMGAMSPEKRPLIISLGMRSILAGTVATCMTGAVVGIVW